MKIHELIEKPENWTQGAFARTSKRTPTNSADPEATCWCLAGAVNLCYKDEEEKRKVRSLIKDRAEKPVIIFNDRSTHAEVLALVKRLDV